MPLTWDSETKQEGGLHWDTPDTDAGLHWDTKEPVKPDVISADAKRVYSGQGAAGSPAMPGYSTRGLGTTSTRSGMLFEPSNDILQHTNPQLEKETEEMLVSPLIKFERVTDQERVDTFGESNTGKIVKGFQNGLADLAEGLTTPETIAVGAWATVPGPIGLVIRALLTLDMAKGSASSLRQIYDAGLKGDTEEVTRLSTGYAANTLMAIGLGKHTVEQFKFGMPITKVGADAWSAGKELGKLVGKEPMNLDFINEGSVKNNILKTGVLDNPTIPRTATAFRDTTGPWEVRIHAENVGRPVDIENLAPVTDSATLTSIKETADKEAARVAAEAAATPSEQITLVSDAHMNNWLKELGEISPEGHAKYEAMTDAEKLEVRKRVSRNPQQRHMPEGEQTATDAATVPTEPTTVVKPEVVPPEPETSKKPRARTANQEFDDLVAEYGEQEGWGTDLPSTATRNSWRKGPQAGSSVKGTLNADANARQAAAKALFDLRDVGGNGNDPTAAHKAQMLPKLKEYIARKELERNAPDTLPDDVGYTATPGIDDPFAQPAEAPSPKLRSGEKQGDVFANQTEDFALVGEKGKDLAKAEEARAKAELDKAEAKAIQERQQPDFFKEPAPVEAKVKSDWISKLESLKQPLTPGVGANPFPEVAKAVLNTAIDIAIGAINAAEAISKAMDHIRKNTKDLDYNDIQRRLEDFLSGKETKEKPISIEEAIREEFDPSFQASTGIKIEAVEEARAERGLDPIEKPTKESQEEVLERVKSRIEQDPAYQDNLVEELEFEPRPITPDEVFALDMRYVELQAERAKAMRQGEQAAADGKSEGVERAQELVEMWDSKLGDFEHMVRKTGTLWGRTGEAMQRRMKADFSLEAMEQRVRADNGFEGLSADKLDQIKKDFDKIQAKNEAFQERVKILEKEKADAETRAVLAELNAKQAESPYSQFVLDAVKKHVDRWEARAEVARERLKGKLFTLSPDVLYELGMIARANISKKSMDFAKWSVKMVEEFGPKIKEYLEQAWKDGKASLEKDIYGEPDKVKDAINRPGKIEGEITELGLEIGDAIEQGKNDNVTTKVRKLARLFVEQGIREVDPLLDAIHKAMLEIDPNITRREAQDALTGYGKWSQPKQDAISKIVADLKGQALELGKLMDLEAGDRLKKTGFLRGKMSDARRRLVAKVNEYKRRFGVLDARKTYYRNQITDLEAQIKSRKKFLKTKTPSPTDAELEGLIEKRNALKQDFDDIFGDPKLTDEQRLKIELSIAKRTERDWNQKLENAKVGRFGRLKEGAPKLTSAEIEAIKARTEEMRERVKELEDLNEGIQEEKQLKELDAAIADRAERIKFGNLAKDPIKTRIETPKTKAARAKLDALNAKLEALREGSGMYDRKRIDDALKSVEQRTAEAEKEINTGVRALKSKGAIKATTPELESAKADLKDLIKIRDKLRRAAVAKTPEEIALQSLLTRMKKKTADYLDRVAKGNFEPKAKRTPLDISKDPKAMKAAAELKSAQNAFEHRREEWRRARRTNKQIAVDAALEVIDLGKGQMTSYDVSAVGRQGLFWSASYPFRAARAAKKMFGTTERVATGRFLLSEERAMELEAGIKHLPNADIHRKAGLRIVDLNKMSSRANEVTRGRLANKVPWIKSSNLGYNTFLNLIRSEGFDLIWDSLDHSEKTLANAKSLAESINDMTGYGTVTKGAHIADAAGLIVWSPRLLISRINLVTIRPLRQGPEVIRKEMRKIYARALGSAAVVYALANLSGAKLETDPRSSDLGKAVFGNTRYDPMGGLLQVTSLVARHILGGVKSLKTGKIIPTSGDMKITDADDRDIINNFVWTKVRPEISAYFDWKKGEDQYGNKVDGAELAKRALIPMSLKDIGDIMIDNGIPRGLVLETLGMFGGGLQYFDPSKKATNAPSGDRTRSRHRSR